MHNKREMFLEDGDITPELQQQEHEADTFARDFLIPVKEFEAFAMSGSFTKATVTAFADALGIKPSIVIGRLSHDGLIPYNHYLRKELDR